MQASIKLTRKTSLERTIESKDIAAMQELIAAKTRALAEARENAQFYDAMQNYVMRNNELARAQRLERDLAKLKRHYHENDDNTPNPR